MGHPANYILLGSVKGVTYLSLDLFEKFQQQVLQLFKKMLGQTRLSINNVNNIKLDSIFENSGAEI